MLIHESAAQLGGAGLKFLLDGHRLGVVNTDSEASEPGEPRVNGSAYPSAGAWPRDANSLDVPLVAAAHALAQALI